MEQLGLGRILKFLPGIVAGLTIHEFSHALVAHKCGDPTSRDQGRVSLNPLKHIDLLGFVMLLVAGFGWARPVQFNENNLRNPEKDVMKIAVAGPLSNAIFAMILSVIFSILRNFVTDFTGTGGQFAGESLLYAIYINWGLFIFNLIPLPPLDGSHLLLNYFKKKPSLYNGLYRYVSWIFLGMILVTMLTKVNLLPIWPLVNYLGDGFLSIVGYR